MKESLINLSVPNPCDKKWENMKPTTKGGFCLNCNTEVVDFTKMSDEELVNFFQKRRASKICGKFKESQLKQDKIIQAPTISIASRLRKLILSFFIGLSFTSIAKGQNNSLESLPDSLSFKTQGERIIKGIVFEEDGEPAKHVVISLYYNEELLKQFVSDIDGNFELKIPENYNAEHVKLVLQYLGVEDFIFLNRKQNYYEITLKTEVIIVGTIEVTKKSKAKKKKNNTIIGTPRF